MIERIRSFAQGVAQVCGETTKQVAPFSFCIVLTLVLTGSTLLAAEPGPVRVEVITGSIEAPKGVGVPVKVRLVGSRGEVVAARRALDVEVIISDRSGELSRQTVRFSAEEAERQIIVEPRDTGVLSVEAVNDELLQGAALLRVRPMGEFDRQRDEFTSMRRDRGDGMSDAAIEPSAETRPRVTLPSPSGSPPVHRPDLVLGRDDAGPAGEVTSDVELEPESGASTSPVLEFTAIPNRPLRADDADEAIIYGYVIGDSSHGGIDVELLGSRGNPTPMRMSIPPNAASGVARLTTNQPGPLTVEYKRSQPDIRVSGPDRFEFAVHPPVSRLDISGPSSLDVGDSATLAVDLVDDDGTPVPTISARPVRFQVLSGKVRLRDTDARIQENQAGTTTHLIADWWGDARIQVSSPFLKKQEFDISIGLPWVLIGITAAGGLIGGLIAWKYGVGKGQRLAVRLLVGLVSGFFLYWMLAYFAVPAAPDVIAQVAVRNPFGAFCSAVLGGWMGTEVFELGARRIGLAGQGG